MSASEENKKEEDVPKEEEKVGKTSKGCCVHPSKAKVKKNEGFAKGFAAALGGEEKDASKEKEKTGDSDDEETPAEKPEAEDDEIPEEKLIEELQIPTDEEVVSMIQLRIFDMTKVTFADLKACKNLVLRQNLIHDLHPLPPNLCENLVELDLYDNKIKAIRHLECLVNLKTLDLSYNNIRIIENLNMPQLEVLFLTENKITKIQNLENLVNLKQLELGSNRIRKIEGLDALVNLADLWLGKNKITELSGLTTLTHLRRLSLQANRLTEVAQDALLHNTALTDLHLSENGIKKIENISHLSNIRLLDFCFNPVTAITEADQLPKMEEFWLTDARVADWKEVEKLEKVKTLKTVYLERNPVEDVRYRHKLATMMPWLEEVLGKKKKKKKKD